VTLHSVLVLSDESSKRRSLRDALQPLFPRVMLASSMAEAAKCLASDHVQLAVLDYEDDDKALRTLAQLRRHTPNLGAIVTCGQEDALTEVAPHPIHKQALHDAVQRLLAKIGR